MTPLRLRLLIGAGVLAILAVFAIVGGDDTPSSPPVGPSDQTQGAPLVATDLPDDTTQEQVTAPVLEGSGVTVDAARPVVEGGYPETEQGAVHAAVALLEATEDVVSMTPDEAAQTQRLVSTQDSAERLVGEVHAQMVNLKEQAPQGVQIWIAPIEFRSSATEGGYDVSIWYTQVVAIGTDTAVDNWTTVTYSMRWEQGAWKMSGSVSVPGPTPARSASTAPTSASALVGILLAYSDEGLNP